MSGSREAWSAKATDPSTKWAGQDKGSDVVQYAQYYLVAASRALRPDVAGILELNRALHGTMCRAKSLCGVQIRYDMSSGGLICAANIRLPAALRP